MRKRTLLTVLAVLGCGLTGCVRNLTYDGVPSASWFGASTIDRVDLDPSTERTSNPNVEAPVVRLGLVDESSDEPSTLSR